MEFQLEEDAVEAIDNMDGSELFGRTLKVNLAKPSATKGQVGKALWATEEYLQKSLNEGDVEEDNE